MKRILYKNSIKILISLFIALFIEIFICNYPAFRTMATGNSKDSVDFEIVDNTVIISNLDVRVTSINIEFEKLIGDSTKYELAYRNYGDETIYKIKEKTIWKNGKNYINFDTEKKCDYIYIAIDTEINSIEPFIIKNISINSPNFNISVFRIIIFLIIVVIAVYIKDDSIYKVKYNKASKLQNCIFIIFLIILCLGIFIYNYASKGFSELTLKPKYIKQTDAFLLQTEAFINKSAKLLIKPSEELIAMDNPYDNGARLLEKINFQYDIAYFKGAYYSYYGIAPIILLILPFRLITGFYLQVHIFTLIFIFAIIFLLYDVYKKMVDKYVGEILLFHFYVGYIVMFWAGNIINLVKGDKYELAIASGITFILLSIRLSMTINKWNKFKNVKLIILRIVYWFNCFIEANIYILLSFNFIFDFNRFKNKI